MANTPNLGLHQWQSGDSFLREEFNEDFRKIDTAVGAGLKLITGSFTPDNTDNRTIVLGFRPKLLLLFGQADASGSPDTLMAVVFDNFCFNDYGHYNNLDAQTPSITLTDNGFVIAHRGSYNYNGGKDAYYVAFR